MAEQQFSLTLQSVEVELDGQPFTVKELDGQGKGQYLSKIGSKIMMDDKGRITGMKDFTGLETNLLSLCLYDGAGVLVPTPVMSKWPSTVLGKLFEIAQGLSGLSEKAQAEQDAKAKNS
jgi:hypothetical protein